MQPKSTAVRALVAVLVGALLTAGCGTDGDRAQTGDKMIVIGSAAFSESLIVANMYARAL